MGEIGENSPAGFSDVSKAEIITHRDLYTSCLDLGLIFVDRAATTPFWGTELNPFLTVTEGLINVPDGGRVLIHGAHRYLENISIGRPMRLEAVGGPVTLGNY